MLWRVWGFPGRSSAHEWSTCEIQDLKADWPKQRPENRPEKIQTRKKTGGKLSHLSLSLSLSLSPFFDSYSDLMTGSRAFFDSDFPGNCMPKFSLGKAIESVSNAFV